MSDPKRMFNEEWLSLCKRYIQHYYQRYQKEGMGHDEASLAAKKRSLLKMAKSHSEIERYLPLPLDDAEVSELLVEPEEVIRESTPPATSVEDSTIQESSPDAPAEGIPALADSSEDVTPLTPDAEPTLTEEDVLSPVITLDVTTSDVIPELLTYEEVNQGGAEHEATQASGAGAKVRGKKGCGCVIAFILVGLCLFGVLLFFGWSYVVDGWSYLVDGANDAIEYISEQLF